MDFLANVKQKIQEMEEQARLLQQMEQGATAGASSAQGKKLFQPKNQKANPLPQGRAPRAGSGKGTQPSKTRPMTGSESFSTPECVNIDGRTDPAPRAVDPRPSGGLSGALFKDLHGRLDEAFLLTEVLGPPRCVRGWEED